MDRLLFGDNQFFGVNHMSEEKARAQAMRFQSLDAVMEVLDAAYDAGVRTFMCTTHDRVGEIGDRVRADPERYADLEFFPCMPYAHKYANAVTEDGMLGALKRFLPDEGLVNAAIRGGSSMAKKDIEGVTTLLIDAEMKMFEGLRTPVVFLQNVVVDLLLGLGFNAAFRIFADRVKERHGAEPGFITMNLPALLPVLEAQGIENPIVCSNINKIGFRMSGGLEAYERTLREHRFRAIAMSVFASGAIPADEAIEWVCAQPNLESIVFGASSARNIRHDPRPRGPALGPRAGAQLTTLLVASTGGHLKQLHRLHRRLDGIEGPFRWATFDTPQSRSLLAGEVVDFVHFVGGRDPSNVLRNVPLVHRILREHDIDTIVSTGSAMALPFYALGRARGLELHYIESAARSDGPSKTASMIARIPGVNLYTQYPAWADEKWRFRGAVFDSFVAADEPRATDGRIRKVVVSLGTFKDYGFERLVRRLLEILPPDADVLWQTGDTDVTGLGITGHHAIPERELSEAIREADVLVAHAGVGTALAALEVGACPVLVPRRFSHGEHVDDHQIQIAGELSRRGLALTTDADELTLDHLLTAAATPVATLPEDPPFVLAGTRATPLAIAPVVEHTLR